MPAPLDGQIRRKVIQQWFNGLPRDKIAAENNIGAGTVSGIVNDFKKNLQNSNIDSVRELAVEAKKQKKGRRFSQRLDHVSENGSGGCKVW
jgi:hypothetical protein